MEFIEKDRSEKLSEEITDAKLAADEIVRADPDLSAPEHGPLLTLLGESASARALLVTA